MKVRLEENFKISLKLKIIYIAIIILCIVSVIMAIYLHINGKDQIIPTKDKELPQISEDQLQGYKSGFNSIFYNGVNYLNNNSYKIKKLDKEQEIVYMGYKIFESKVNEYELKVNIPYINIDSEDIANYNKEIKDIFEEKAMDILNGENDNTIYTVNYNTYISNNILSLIVRSTLKEGDKPQRDIVQTYNYNLATHQECTIDELLELRGITKQEANKKIKKEIKSVQETVEQLGKLGYTIYNRDYESDNYNINNATEFFMGDDNVIYIIYAYGNQNYTSEIDIVVM